MEIKLFLPIYNVQFNRRIQKSLIGFLQNYVGDLELNELKILSISEDRRFVTILITGTDAEIASKYLIREFGTAIDITKLPSKTNKKRVLSRFIGVKDDNILLDIGTITNDIFEIESVPFLEKILGIKITKSIDITPLVKNLGFRKYFPIPSYVTLNERVYIDIRDDEFSYFKKLLDHPINMLIAYGITRTHLENIIKKSGLWRGIRSIRRIGFLEHIILLSHNKWTIPIFNILSKNNIIVSKIIKKRIVRFIRSLSL